MHADTLTLKQIFEPDRRYLVPLFQRPYVWQAEAQWSPLWDDVRTVAERVMEDRDVRPHFLGAIVLEQTRQPTSRVEARQIIDGQQRLTTLQLLLEAACDICQQRGWTNYHRALVKLTRNDNPLSVDPTDVFKVWPTNLDRPAFRDVMQAESAEKLTARYAAEGKSPEGHLAKAYLFFSDRVENWVGTTPEAESRIAALYAALHQWIRLVVVDLGEDDDPQLIFETLNARGTPLLPADLVKNYLFHMAHRAKQPVERLYELYWKAIDDEAGYWRAEVVAGRLKRSRIDLFLQHYLAMQTGDDVAVAHLYNAFRDYLKNSPETPEGHLASLASYAKVFRRFDAFEPGSRLAVFFARLEELQVTTAQPLLLHLFSLGLKTSELEAVATDIESFLVRRMVCQLTTKNYNRLFLDILNSLRHTRENVAAALREELTGARGESVRWPRDAELRSAWLESPVYKRLVRRRVRMVLETLEIASRDSKTENVALPKKLTIEHLLPQSWQEHWPLGSSADPVLAKDERDRLLHTFGNLTLLTRSLNPAVSNGAWKGKRDEIGAKSVLILNHQLRTLDSWDERAMRTRGSRLLTLATGVWPGPPPLAAQDEEDVPDYAALGRQQLAASATEPSERLAPTGFACPIDGCNKVFERSLMGWDAHVGSLRKHANWYPDVVESEARRQLFRETFPGFMTTGAQTGSVSREYWEKRAHPGALAVVDRFGEMLNRLGATPRWTYNRGHIALGGSGLNFGWFHPNKTRGSSNVILRVDQVTRSELIASLQAAGLSPAGKRTVRLPLTQTDVAQHAALLEKILDGAQRHAAQGGEPSDEADL